MQFMCYQNGLHHNILKSSLITELDLYLERNLQLFYKKSEKPEFLQHRHKLGTEGDPVLDV